MRWIIGLAFVIAISVSGCASIDSTSEKMNYTEAKEQSTSISYYNLLQYPNRHQGTLLEQEGEISQVFDDGILLHTKYKPIGRIENWEGFLVWIDIENNLSIYEEGHYINAFGRYKGKKTYQTVNSEYNTVPRMGLNFVTGSNDVTVHTVADGATLEEYPKDVKVDSICVNSECKSNVYNATFNLEVGNEHEVNIKDSTYGSVRKNITVGPSDRERAEISVGDYRYGPKKVINYYVENLHDSWHLLSSDARVSGSKNTLENRMREIDSLGRADLNTAFVKNIETVYEDEKEVRFKLSISHIGDRNGIETEVTLVKENHSWKLNRPFNPYDSNGGNVNFDIY